MKVYKSYHYKLKLTKVQAETVDQWLGTCRYVYNLALETKIAAWQKGVTLSKFDLFKQLPTLKDIDWIKTVPSQSLYAVIERLDAAYNKFFSGGGFPKWAKKSEYNSMIFKLPEQTANGFKLPKLGNVKIFKDRMPNGKLKTANIVKNRNNYYLGVTFESESQNIYPTDKNQVVGLDMGLAYFLTDSNGIFIKNPKHFKKYETKLRIKNRALVRKKKGSNGYKKAKLELKRLYEKITSTRKDFLNKVSFKYVRENTLIVSEELKVSNMAKNTSLAKYIYDAGWGNFFLMLDYKCKYYEKTFVQVKPHYTSQTCNACGYVAKENRVTQSIFKCVQCGHGENADYNAAKNILGQGMALVRQREGLPCA
ncbi:RNA-guided endonuclease InsQ/TnpB family protein [Runella sp.]|uniref:RNA-guided endonuclease InsQ/TnpB family protein n=1 Tax=Runella sp. TaxID=1960881 RepID=UPI003D111958